MNIQPDFEEFLRLLEKYSVEYLIVGGYAVAFHGYPRFTKDIDIFFNASDGNIGKLREALAEFGFSKEELEIEAFSENGNVISFGREPVRIDLLNEIDGVRFEEARRNAVKGRYGKTDVLFIGREDLLRNKRATPRMKDKADVEELE